MPNDYLSALIDLVTKPGPHGLAIMAILGYWKLDKIEIRHYASYTVAEVLVPGPADKAGNQAFPIPLVVKIDVTFFKQPFFEERCLLVLD